MSITLTESATQKLADLLAEEDNPDLRLRIFVSGGGCSGFQYGFTFDDRQEPNDTVVGNGNVQVLVDEVSLRYLAGAQVDFVEDLNGAQFVIRNPNAASSCGCGNSFEPKAGGGCANA